MDIYSYLDMKFNVVKSSVIHIGSFNCPSSASLVVEIDLKYLIIPVLLTLGLMYKSRIYSVSNKRWLHE